MKRLGITLLLGTLALLAVGPRTAGAATLFFDYVGFDYEDPNPDPSQFGEALSGYNGLGTVPGVFAPMLPDTANNQYTYFMTGLTVVNRTPVGPYLIVDYSPGTLQIWEDSKTSGTPADFGVSPPNALAPATFTDGTLFLVCSLTGFQYVFNTANGSGSFESSLTVTGGSQLVNIPINQRVGWTFAGTSANALNIPAGYAHQVDGQTFLNEPVPTVHSTWGHIKALYR
jgi:hypothetical protein